MTRPTPPLITVKGGKVTIVAPGWRFGRYKVILRREPNTWGVVNAKGVLVIEYSDRLRSDQCLLPALKTLAKLWDATGAKSDQQWQDLKDIDFPLDQIGDCAIRRKFM